MRPQKIAVEINRYFKESISQKLVGFITIFKIIKFQTQINSFTLILWIRKNTCPFSFAFSHEFLHIFLRISGNIIVHIFFYNNYVNLQLVNATKSLQVVWVNKF